MTPDPVVMTGGQPKTLSGVCLDSLGFWFFLCMLEGFAWVVWTLLEIQNHYYFSTTPFGTAGAMIPW
jgi:hypothetical protein